MSLFKLPEENWKPVVGYENLYQVNSKGEVARIGGKVLKPYQGQVYLSKSMNLIKRFIIFLEILMNYLT